jgi:hypothetical protein
MTDRPTFTPNMQRHMARRQELWRTALEYALVHSGTIRRDMQNGRGVWFDAMGPLAPDERTLVLRELRKIWHLEQ